MPESKKNKIKELLERTGVDGIEIRTMNIPAKVELRKDGTPGSIYGYPIVYNKDSEDMWGFTERIATGAAKKALKRSNVRALKNHDPSLIFGRQGVNLTLKEDATGLKYEATPIDTRNFREVAEEVRLELLTGQSFGFTVVADEWTDLDKDMAVRTIIEIGEIFDVGPVTYPAYQDTTVALRSLEAAKQEPEDKPAFSSVTILIKIGNEEEEFDLNDTEAQDKFIQSIRSGLSPTADDSGITGDEPTLDKPSESTSELFDKMEQMEKKHSEV